MLRKILAVVMLVGLLAAFGCSGTPTSPANDIDAFFGDQGPNPTGFVGDYTYTGNDGYVETGQLIADESGNITMQPDGRSSSVFTNFWFDISVDYLNPRYYTGMGLPVYYLGDCFDYKLQINYKQNIPLDWYPILYAKMEVCQRYYPSMALLPCPDTCEVWDPLQLPPNSYTEIYDNFCICAGTQPGNNCTTVNIDLKFFCGNCEFNLASGICGFWDP